jgi:iron complex outermembrane recepter protein
MLSSRNQVARAVRRAIMLGAIAATVGLPAMAQDQQDTAPESEPEEIVITGSRIPQPHLEAVSPVKTIGAEEIQHSGVTRIEDLLNTLPQVSGQFGSGVSNGATGEATVSLRGLGSNRTLVLVNGRRLMPGDPTQNASSAPDLNQIPSALVNRVDILTGGASSTYGADAVAGVVNFVMNDHFEGVRVDANFGINQHSNSESGLQSLIRGNNYSVADGTVWDGASKDLTIIAGSNFADGRGNATAYLGYRRANPVTQGSRDFSSCALSTTGGALSCGGSSTSYPGRFNIGGKNYSVGGPDGHQLTPGFKTYNYAPLNYFQRPDERYTGGAFVHFDINEHASAYTEFMFMDDRTLAQIAPSGAFFGAGTGFGDGSSLVNCDNPYLSGQEVSVLCGKPDANGNAHVLLGRRNVEGGPRFDDLGHTSFRTVAGVKGEIADGWSYDTFFENGITRLNEQYFNDVSRTRLANALQAVVDPATGEVVCKANANHGNGAPGCAPYNIFQIGGVSKAATNYISVPGLQKGATTERVFNANFTGDLGKQGVMLPTAHDGLAVNVGTEWREEITELNPDLEYQSNDLAGQGSPTLPIHGQYHVWEGFAEAKLPILQDMPFAQSLTAEAGYRYSKYTLAFGSTDTYKFGLQWAPIKDVHVRAGYQRAVRAPNNEELYLQPHVGLDGTADPCAGVQPAATLAQCARSGVTPAEYGNIPSNPARQYNGQFGGNSSLRPEKADTYTAGVVITPSAIPDLNVTLDYYNIKIRDLITTYGANLVLSNCVNSGDPAYCDKVVRTQGTGTAADGSLWIGYAGYINDGIYNLGAQWTSGIDLTSQYKLDFGTWGKVDFDLAGSYTLKFATQPLPGGGSYDCVGLYGPTCSTNGSVIPKWKHKLRTTWRTPIPGLDAWLTWRFIGKMGVDASSPQPQLNGAYSALGAQVPNYSYIDLGGAYTIASKYKVRVGVNNVTDRNPPFIGLANLPGTFGNGNTLPSTYDVLGRYVFANVTLDF